ncbi:MAG TPA: hypothetical protein VK674_00975 [Candidatus Limnocylindria bacterium]|nr:hypothetical protein [Candidatus Limnocylindria bacterium]
MTKSGGARSGKGTSAAHLRDSLEAIGYGVRVIDQGMKFRAMGKVATDQGQPLDSPTALGSFISSDRAHRKTLAVLDEAAGMSELDKKAFLYTPELSSASGMVGQVPSAHKIAVALLETEVRHAVEDKKDLVVVDGRAVEGRVRRFEAEGLLKFTMGWFFKCDPAVAARRSLGLFGDIEDTSVDQQQQLLYETFRISDRNRSDTLRDVDPMHEPTRAYKLDLSEYGTPDSDVPYKVGRDVLRTGMAVVDTSYTRSVEEMTGPVTGVSMMVLRHQGMLSHSDIHIPVARVSV